MSLRSIAVRLRSRSSRSTPPASAVACRAPFSSMYLDQRGFVRACCMNDYQLLGNVTEMSLTEIWHGAEAQELRRAMERQDLSVGCEFCQWQVDEGRPELAFSRWFEHFEDTEPEPRWPQQLELAMSNTCNLQCAMCNAEWSSSIRTTRDGLPPLPKAYDDAFFDELASFLPHLTSIKFLGGEPFLASETLRVMEMLVDGGYRPKIHVTTNGTQWTPRVQRLFDQLPIEVAVSLDAATPEVYDQVRIGSSWDLVQANMEHFLERSAGVTVTYCLMRSNWQDFGAFCQQADARGIGCAVNTVTEPAHLSLYRMPPGELAEVVGGLDDLDRQIGSTLTLSRTTWAGELIKLRQHLADAEAGRPIVGLDDRKMNADFPRPFAPVVDDAPEVVAALEARVSELSEALLGAEIGSIELDPQQIITEVNPDDGFFGVTARDLIGCSMNDMLPMFTPHLGDLTHLQTLDVGEDVAAFEVSFEGGQAIRALHGPLLFDGGRRPGTRLVLADLPGDAAGPESVG